MKELLVEPFDLLNTLAKIYREGGLLIATVPYVLTDQGSGSYRVTEYRVVYVEARFR